MPVADPFEHEVTLADQPRVLSFGPRGLEIPLKEFLRHLAFDLVGAIPRPLGKVREDVGLPPAGAAPAPGARVFTYRSEFHQVGPSVLALGTEIEEAQASHRVIELHGMDEDLRVRLNLTLLNPEAVAPDASSSVRESVEAGRPLGQVRIWGNESSLVGDMRRRLTRQIKRVGVDSRVLERAAREPVYRPPAAGSLALPSLPADDLVVSEALLALLTQLSVEGAQKRAPRQISVHRHRVRRKGAIVGYRYETHRGGTGVLHTRRREVEAGAERPGLVRTFVVAGLRGAARLRIRDVGGRASAEFAGTAESVEAIRVALQATLGGRA